MGAQGVVEPVEARLSKSSVASLRTAAQKRQRYTRDRMDALRGVATLEEPKPEKREQPEQLRAHSFKKGQSGNPGGVRKKPLKEETEAERTKKATMNMVTLAQAQAEIAIGALVEITVDQFADPRARVAAAAEILDRGFGKPKQSVDLQATMSLSEEFEAFIRSFTPGDDAKLIESLDHPHINARDNQPVVIDNHQDTDGD